MITPTHSISRKTRHAARNGQRGAAFLIAIVILIILVAIGTTFFSVSRLELKTATNVTQTVRSDLLNDAANAIAMHHLNQYFFRSPDVTSADHSFRTLFDGTAFVGKSWARRKEPTAADPNPIHGKNLQDGGVPEVDVHRIQRALDAYARSRGLDGPVVLYWPDDKTRERIFQGSRSNNWLYIPRIQAADPLFAGNPFDGGNEPDVILLYDYEGDVNDLRNGDENAANRDYPRSIQLRVEDGGDGGLGTLLADTPGDFININNFLAGIPAFADLQFQYFSYFFDGNDIARRARYPFATTALFRPRSGDLDRYGEFENAAAGAFGYREEQVDTWTDVDNDGDGLRDAIWLPIPQDIFLPNDLVDNDLDGLVDERQDNQIDDDGDGKVDYEAIDADGQPAEDPFGVILHDMDEALEPGVLVYHGLGPLVEIDGVLTRVGDGLDNNGNGLIDETGPGGEDKLFLTAPLPGVRIPLDLDGDGVASREERYRPVDPVTKEVIGDSYIVENPAVIVGPTVIVPIGGGDYVTLTEDDVDVLDNDYDLLVNDYYAYAYIGPYQPGDNVGSDFYNPAEGWQPMGNWETWSPALAESPAAYSTQILKSYTDINRRLLPGFRIVGRTNGVEGYQDWWSVLPADEQNALLARIRITHSGEPTCDLVGRAAITISDEAGKINLNVAGARTFNPFASDEINVMQPAFNEGTGPHEYDLLTLPIMAAPVQGMVNLADLIAGYRTGGPRGLSIPQLAPGDLSGEAIINNQPVELDYRLDAALPGLGRVDDNGDALLRAIDGIDNDGNGIRDEGFISPEDLPANFDEVIDFREGRIHLVENSEDTPGFTDPAQLAFAKKWFRLGSFEGVDEPTERQLFSPLRNPQAESDQKDNIPLGDILDASFEQTARNFVDEVGELGDRVFQSDTDLAALDGVESSIDFISRLATVHSTDRNVSFIRTATGIRALNTTDINRANAKQLASKLVIGNDFRSSLQLADRLQPFNVFDNTPLMASTLDDEDKLALGRGPVNFAQALRRGDTRLLAHDPRPNDNTSTNRWDGGFLFNRREPGLPALATATELPLDPQLELLQMAVNIVDARDAGHARSELITERRDLIQKSPAELGKPSFGYLRAGEELLGNDIVQNWPLDYSPVFRIPEENLFPTEELELHLKDVLNTDDRRLQMIDYWWLDLTVPTDANPNERPEQRHISYAAAGVESIRINELMVRPVRRLEAEAVPNQAANLPDDPIQPADFTPKELINLDPSPFAETQSAVLPGDIEVARPADRYPHGEPTTDPQLYFAAGESPTPEFALTRRNFQPNYTVAPGAAGLGIAPVAPSAAWTLSHPGTPLLGDSTFLETTGHARSYTAYYHDDIDDPDTSMAERPVLIPDVLEFIVGEPDARLIGLPNGRYYLAVKLEGDYATAVSTGRLRYAVKYHNAAGTTISDDIQELLDDIDAAAAATADISTADLTALRTAFNAYGYYFENYFRPVPASHLANGPGEPNGWVFIDATPQDRQVMPAPVDPAVVVNHPDYFIDFPPAYNVTLGVYGTARVSVEFTGVPDRWLFRVRANGNLGYDITSISVNTGSGPLGVAQNSEFFFHTINDAELAELMEGGWTIGGQVRDAGGATFSLGTHAIGRNGLTERDLTHTVTVPPIGSGFRLSVAFTTSPIPRQDPADELPYDAPGGEIGINFLDFSQEPDHEYIELANVSDDAIDLTGWTLEVGPPQRDGIDWYPFNTKWRIPEGTTISPGGMLLLTFDKFDSFDNPASPNALPLYKRNGIGMAQTNEQLAQFAWPLEFDLPDLYRVTVPPLRDNSSDPSVYLNNLASPYQGLPIVATPKYTPTSFYSDTTGSVFARTDNPNTPQNEYVDYVDHYGAGVSTVFATQLGIEIGNVDYGLAPDQRRAIIETQYASSPESPRPDFPWDRIVELENIRLWQRDDEILNTTNSGNVFTAANIDNVDMLARFVLRGGVLPNYPEQDGYDNDGDGGYMDSSGNYNLGILEQDLVDNDLDGFVDERAAGVLINETPGDYYLVWPFSSEGVDEGRLGIAGVNSGLGPLSIHPYGPGSYGPGVLPFMYFPSRGGAEAYMSDSVPLTPLDDRVDATDRFDLFTAPVYVDDGRWSIDAGPQPAFNGTTLDIAPGATTQTLTLTYRQDYMAVPFVNRQAYYIEIPVNITNGSLTIMAGSAELTVLGGTGVRELVMMTFDEIQPVPPIMKIVAQPNTTATIGQISAFPIGVSNQHGSSYAAGINSYFMLADGAQSYVPVLPKAFTPVGVGDALYLGSDLDPPDWKAFVQRRMHPGDNVVVSLYDATGEVADRVTYREFDVINRTIDDVVASPYEVLDYFYLPNIEGVAQQTSDVVSLHPDYPTFWLPNHMGLDFYRSLERKNPLAAGDKFGTENRWQATDGNYDDWSDSPSFFARTSTMDNPTYGAVPPLDIPNGEDFFRMSRFYAPELLTFDPRVPNVEDSLRLNGHAMFGSPLRMNLAHRKLVNPIDPLKLEAAVGDEGLPQPSTPFTLLDNITTGSMRYAQFLQEPDTRIYPTYPDGERLEARLWEHRLTETPIPNSPYNSPLDMASAPLVTGEHHMINTGILNTPYNSYLHDELRLNYFTNTAQINNDITQRSTLVAHAEDRTEGALNSMAALLNAASTDSVVLTVAQANFIPIRPTTIGTANEGAMQSDDFPDGQGFSDLLHWRDQPGGWEPPAAWTPVYTYADTYSAPNLLASEIANEPYPPGPNGLPLAPGPLRTDPRAVLFPPSLVFGTEFQQAFISPDPNFPLGAAPRPLPTINPVATALARVPLKQRVAMYVSKRRSLNNFDEMDPAHAPEALWVWDAEDGLENGEYEVYIGTFMPELARKIKDTRQTVRMIAAAGGGELLENLIPSDGGIESAVATDFAERDIANRDPVHAANATTSPFNAEYEIEILTNPADALGVRPCVTCEATATATAAAASDTFGLVHPKDWRPEARYKAREDGYIYYGNDAAAGWKPNIVRVTDNFLAIRVRNVGSVTETGAISHIVLAPCKRTPGRININTANFQVADMRRHGGQSRKALVHPLAGLPGIRDAFGEHPLDLVVGSRFMASTPVSAQVDDSSARKYPPDATRTIGLPEPYEFSLWNGGVLEDLRLGDLSSARVPYAMPPLAVENGLEPLLPPAANPNDEVMHRNAEQAARYILLSLLQLGRTERQDGRYYESIAELLSENSAFEPAFKPVNQLDSGKVHPLSNNAIAEARAREIHERVRKLANSITVRSDVFEIITTVQAGYGVDSNNDGKFNYRDNNEFITTAETRSRMVYERRVPADNTDEADVSKQ